MHCSKSAHWLTFKLNSPRRHSRSVSVSGFLMSQVRALSGQLVAELQIEELRAKLQETAELQAVVLKELLATQLGCSRFLLKLSEGSTVIDDYAPLTGPKEFTVVKMDFAEHDQRRNVTFMDACSSGRTMEVEDLLRARQNPDEADADNSFRGIHYACRSHRLNVVRLLLEAGADKDAVTDSGWTPLHIVCHAGIPTIAGIAAAGASAIVEVLLEAGADKDAKTNHGMTALHLATERGYSDIVGVLLRAGADFELRTPGLETALHLAAFHFRPQCLRLLLEAGADAQAVEVHGLTVLHMAVENLSWSQEADILRRLIEASDVEAKIHEDGATALHCAAADNLLTQLSLLLDAGANKDVAQDNGRTPLHIAAENGHLQIVSRLLDAGANKDVVDSGFLSPLDLAVQAGHSEVADLLQLQPPPRKRERLSWKKECAPSWVGFEVIYKFIKAIKVLKNLCMPACCVPLVGLVQAALIFWKENLKPYLFLVAWAKSAKEPVLLLPTLLHVWFCFPPGVWVKWAKEFAYGVVKALRWPEVASCPTVQDPSTRIKPPQTSLRRPFAPLVDRKISLDQTHVS